MHRFITSQLTHGKSTNRKGCMEIVTLAEAKAGEKNNTDKKRHIF
jgi:hypothetical protein